MIVCRYCKNPFEQKHPEQRYCRPNHAKAARRLRARRRAAEAAAAIAAGEPLCPRPNKQIHRTPEQAALTWEAKQPELVLYRCRCGALHFGHRHPPYRARIARA
ncbi:hypothetical protein SEA_OTTAWA_95 [Arthrobacter phage Ottawa]|nr:hypothetical protein SEA_KHARCHO_95 [Arthrobacter phage Kharcho]WIC89327.1 hypothetical protein SEA_OTTAWA_95 [Arthrobacter phage Ottawa]